ncbi:MAG: glycosyltransferase family 4 protein [Chitinophagaceae bacterium]|nr:glycosyltransferase family 4 protein [Chitinophagaceae bacterium]
MRKNNVLVFCTDSPGPEYGGAEISLCRTVSYLKNQYDIKFLIHHQAVKKVKTFIEENHFPFHHYVVPNSFPHFFKGIAKAFRVTRKYKGIYVIWCHHLDSNRWLQLWLAFTRSKFIIAERLIPTSKDDFSKSRLTAIIKKFVVSRAYQTILCGFSQAENYKTFFKASNCFIIPNSRPVLKIAEQSKTIRNASGKDDEKSEKVVICIGRLTPQKDQKTLIKAISLIDKSIKVSLLLLGEGEMEQELKRFIERLELENVYFKGFEQNPLKWLATSDVFVLPSLSEGLPGALIEAMAAGIPAIATDIPGNNELIINGQTGLLVPVKNEKALAEAIETILKNRSLAKRLSENAFQHVLKNYSIDQEEKKWLKVFDEI